MQVAWDDFREDYSPVEPHAINQDENGTFLGDIHYVSV